jgi:hypothetical protein
MQPVLARQRATSELLRAACYAAVLFWINLYIARDFFSAHTAFMNSMQGFWIAMAKRGGSGWFWPAWWPYWDCGIPFEAAYPPLVPALTAAWAALASIPHDQAYGCISGFFYCLGPLALFLMAWGVTRAPGASFFAALFYSLTSATQLIIPEAGFHRDEFWEARRLFLAAVWDETPHLAAVSLLPLAVLFLVLSIERRRKIWYAAASITIALMTMASAFGPIIAAMSAACLLSVLRRKDWMRNLVLVAGIGVYAYLMAMAFVPPSVLWAIHQSTAASDAERWTMGSVTALAVVILGWTVLWHLLRRWTGDWRIQFFALLAWLTFSVVFTGETLHRRLMPQPDRYRIELELALALLVVFGARPLFEKLPAAVRRAAILLLLAVAAEQVAHYRKLEKQYLFPVDVAQTVEYRAATWAGRNLAGTRVFFPGSLAQWANDFADVLQFSGGSWSMATNRSQQKAYADIVFGGGPAIREISLTWLKAFGVGAVGMSAPGSEEYWKPYADPAKFNGLPVLWSEGGITIYRVPLRSTSLAHVVPPGAIVRRPPRNPEDDGEAARYAAALDDASLPLADLEWRGRNHIRIRTTASPGQTLSVQVGYHPGWRATMNGQRRAIYKDGLGLMWLRPECNGACAVELDYDGGWELRLCRVVSCLAMFLLVALGVTAAWPKTDKG